MASIINNFLDAPPKIIISCLHCGEQEITKSGDYITWFRFISQGYTQPKVCPKCNDECKRIS